MEKSKKEKEEEGEKSALIRNLQSQLESLQETMNERERDLNEKLREREDQLQRKAQQLATLLDGPEDLQHRALMEQELRQQVGE
ncbi:hypothetical protein CSUI_011567 [Cystoisospora suis]|uniref:Uncharacterized protein n=1 Tax=Cystoisospora suis TaxID=483139 RepID=A0A2C6KE02_9APIC|nr:hypothetical protein CSUI_011567 [Cystoisospora suis]